MIQNILLILWVVCQVVVGFNLILPLILYVFNLFRSKPVSGTLPANEYDYAIIVTAYQQTTLLPAVVDSITRLNYSNYLVYVVADNCDISDLNFNDDKVLLLKPEEVLSSNIRSHFYAIDHFKRPHEYLTIIDSDNLVDPEYLNELNKFFHQGFIAVQGVRKAKNLNTNYACLDEAGDMYYRFIDRKLLYELGSSASLAGSGMAFTTALYNECLGTSVIDGAGFDKVLQMDILNRGKRIAFAEKAIVFDEKTAKSAQLVKQRARWINTWFKYAGSGAKLMLTGVTRFNLNQFLCGLVFSRPPIFIIAGLSMVCMVINLVFAPVMLIGWLFGILAFFTIFLAALGHFKATKSIYIALSRVPLFMFYQVISLVKSKKANELSVATVHEHESTITEIKS